MGGGCVWAFLLIGEFIVKILYGFLCRVKKSICGFLGCGDSYVVAWRVVVVSVLCLFEPLTAESRDGANESQNCWLMLELR